MAAAVAGGEGVEEGAEAGAPHATMAHEAAPKPQATPKAQVTRHTSESLRHSNAQPYVHTQPVHMQPVHTVNTQPAASCHLVHPPQHRYVASTADGFRPPCLSVAVRGRFADLSAATPELFAPYQYSAAQGDDTWDL